jgi:hypothetical protein
MTDEKSIVKKPSKMERLLAKREQRVKMLGVTTENLNVTLECPICRTQRTMTLDKYFEETNYGSFSQTTMKCRLCKEAPEMMFYKADMRKIAAAGFNWQRKRKGISKEDMLKKLDAVDNCTDQMIEVAEGVVDTANLKSAEVKAAVKNIFGSTSGTQPKPALSDENK